MKGVIDNLFTIEDYLQRTIELLPYYKGAFEREKEKVIFLQKDLAKIRKTLQLDEDLAKMSEYIQRDREDMELKGSLKL